MPIKDYGKILDGRLTRILHQGPRMLAEFAAVLAPLWARRGAVIQ